MAGLSEKTKWENEIYRIEENDPVHGGEDGITNKPTKQLANRTQYLKQKLGEAEQKLNPKKLTATTKNAADSTGHTHAIDLASTSTKGLVQLTNDTGLDSEVLALTAKAGKKLAGDIARVQQAANAKYTAKDATTTQKGIVQLNNTLTSSSTTQALTAAQGKALNDKLSPLNVYKIPVKAGGTAVTFDLSNREHWIAEIGSVYRGYGHYQLNLHNNANSTISNLPLNDKTAVQLDISVMGFYTLIRCHYFWLNRTFTSRFDWNKSTSPLVWFEDVKLNSDGKVPRDTVFALSLESNYRVVIRRNEAKHTPYLWFVDNGVNLDKPLEPLKTISSIEARAGKNGTQDGAIKSLIRTHLRQDKNVEVEISTRDASDVLKRMLTMFSKTGAVRVGSGSDNARDMLQVDGTASALAPADEANNDQLPNTFWVRRLLNNAISTINNAIAGKVSKSGDTMKGTLTLPKLALTERNIAFGDDYLYKNNTAGALHGFHLFEDHGEPTDGKKGNAQLFVNNVRTNHLGNGAYAVQYHALAPFFVDEVNSAGRDSYHPFVKGRVRRAGQFGAAFSLGYTTYQGAQGTDGFGRGIIQLIEYNGTHKQWSFEHNGNFHSPGDVVSNTASLNDVNRRLNEITYQKIGNFEIRKYPDGTMIQTYVIHQNDLIDWRKKSFTWAQAFIETPQIFTQITTSINGGDVGINVLTESNHATCYYHEYEHGNVNQHQCRIQFQAIGRWK